MGELCAMQALEIVRTPLGLQGTVIGVKYDEPGNKDSGRIWVRYENGHEAPLEPKQAAGNVQLPQRTADRIVTYYTTHGIMAPNPA
eukprot:jgi/Chrzof1/7182/Cz02g13320.t1